MQSNPYILPPAKEVNYSDFEEVCGYQLLLFKMYEYEGGFKYPPVSSYKTHDILNQGKFWLNKVETLINDILEDKNIELTLECIPDLLDTYDFLYRICNGHPRYEFLASAKDRAVKKWLKGDKSISQTDIALMILSDIYRDSRSV